MPTHTSKPAPAPAPAPASASHDPRASTSAHPSSRTTRGQTFAEGDAARTPASGSQPVDKPPDKHAPIDWTRAPSGEEQSMPMFARAPRRGVEGDSSDLQAENTRTDTRIGADLDRYIAEVEIHLGTCRAAAGRAKEMLEGLVVLDGAQAQADESYKRAGKAYIESKKLGVVEAIGLVIDIAGGLKGIVTSVKLGLATLRRVTAVKQMAKLVPGAIDFAGGAKAAIVGSAGMINAGTVDELSTDATGGLVASVQAQLGPMQATAKVMQSHALRADRDAMDAASQLAKLSADSALAAFRDLSEPAQTDARFAQMETMLDGIASTSESITSDMEAVAALHRARMGGAQSGLEAGTETRALFDRMAKDANERQRSVLEVEYILEVDRRGEREAPRAYGLDTGDPELNHAWSLACASELSREALDNARHFMTKAFLTRDMGAALEAIGVRTVRVPPSMARIMGDFGTMDVPLDKYLGDRERFQEMINPTQGPAHYGGH